ncbi:hypothetical protein FACS1894205_5640 [Alphaproteobacteria bacterium]|nr:hypothetical protein FACS1894205_5640 [Alphaproteobacteria bacterium]
MKMKSDEILSALPDRKESRFFALALALSAFFHFLTFGLYFLYEIGGAQPTPESVEVAIVVEPEAPAIPEREKPLAPLPPPLLDKAEEAAKKSSPESESSPGKNPEREEERQRATPQPERRRVDPLNLGGTGRGDGRASLSEKRAQTLRDMMLSQVARHWRPPDRLRRQNIMVQISVKLLPNGMLAPPLSATQPLDISKAVHDYPNLNPLNQRVLYDLVQAIRIAQPFDVPKDILKSAPMTVRLDFAFDQIP